MSVVLNTLGKDGLEFTIELYGLTREQRDKAIDIKSFADFFEWLKNCQKM